MSDPTFSVSGAVAVLNQTLDYAFPTLIIVGEISDFRISRDKWIYFDIKDDDSKLKCFGTVYQLRMPLESGMQVEIIANPRLHNLYGLSLNIQSVRPIGEGSIKKSSDLLRIKLEKEGLFSVERKRYIAQAPARIGLVCSEQSAGFADFIKIMNARWQGTNVELYDTQVQGESAPDQIVEAIQYFSQQSSPVDVVVVIRGGGSVDDLSAFSDEKVVRAVAASRVPTLVAIGHEVDESLSELAADLRASTPSNAAELLFPDKKEVLKQLQFQQAGLQNSINQYVESRTVELVESQTRLRHHVDSVIEQKIQVLHTASIFLESVHPRSTLKRGYAIIQSNGKLISSVSQLRVALQVEITLKDGGAIAGIEKVQ